jgi:hypothetical protein
MQSSFKPRPPSFIEEIQRDLRATTMQARHIIFRGYSLPQDDVSYRAFFSASRQRSKARDERPVQCKVVGLDSNNSHWCGPADSQKLQVDTVRAAIDIFGEGNVRFFGGGIPNIFLDGDQATEGALERLLDWFSTLEGYWVEVDLLWSPWGPEQPIRRWPRPRPAGSSADSAWYPT